MLKHEFQWLFILKIEKFKNIVKQNLEKIIIKIEKLMEIIVDINKNNLKIKKYWRLIKLRKYIELDFFMSFFFLIPEMVSSRLGRKMK